MYLARFLNSVFKQNGFILEDAYAKSYIIGSPKKNNPIKLKILNFHDYGNKIHNSKMDIKNSDKMSMTNVKATIYLKNSSPIKIVSKYANYNKADHETNFFENVIVTHLIHKATSDNLDISFSSNIAEMYNNIIYKKPGTHLTADRLEIDLITKNSKIFMDNKSERIKIIDKK